VSNKPLYIGLETHKAIGTIVGGTVGAVFPAVVCLEVSVICQALIAVIWRI
jgi:tetrahydromethanopterin S-methyltransferase subunit G